jgi:hypothetical protein
MNKNRTAVFVLNTTVFCILLALAGCAVPGTVIVEGQGGRVVVDSGQAAPAYQQPEMKIPPGVAFRINPFKFS